MERLGAMVSKEVKEGHWEPIQVTRNGLNISHLFLAYDVFFFAKATLDQAWKLREWS